MDHYQLYRICQLAYGREVEVPRFAYLHLIGDPATDTEGVMGIYDQYLVIAFRGTETDEVKDIITDVKVRQLTVPYPDVMPDSPVKVHRGFITAWHGVREKVLKLLADPETRQVFQLVCTGHSLGGALAQLCALDIQYNLGVAPEVVTFGGPRVGNAAFVESYTRRIPHTTRYVNGRDLVPHLPPWLLGYRHTGPEVCLRRRWGWRVGWVTDHSLERYGEGVLANQRPA